jgi:hypothetical protein
MIQINKTDLQPRLIPSGSDMSNTEDTHLKVAIRNLSKSKPYPWWTEKMYIIWKLNQIHLDR